MRKDLVCNIQVESAGVWKASVFWDGVMLCERSSRTMSSAKVRAMQESFRILVARGEIEPIESDQEMVRVAAQRVNEIIMRRSGGRGGEDDSDSSDTDCVSYNKF